MMIRSSRRPRRRNDGKRAILTLAGLLFLLPPGTLSLAHAGTSPQAGQDSTVGVGEPLREATLRGLNGPSRTLSEFRGKPLIINVWASWCSPCRGEMASLDRLAWLDVARSFRIIGVSTDDDPEQARAWLKASNATINQFIDERSQMEHMLGASHIPLTVLVDAHGRVREKIYGARQWDSPESLKLIRQAFAPRQ
jgi:thiol-disulfide isomerase/thioredoxin